MANLITNSYFIREINIPSNALTNDMAEYITQYEKDILIKLLGYELYKDYLSSPGDRRWTRLISGYEYTEEFNGLTTSVKWEGLTNTALVSLIAYYIYYWYMNFHASDTTTIGESITEKENALGISPTSKMVNAWNNCVELYGRISDIVIIPSAYNFLRKFEDDDTNGYTGWIFTSMDKTNILGL